jgi:hypothetical protein
MNGYKLKKKPTTREVADITIELGRRMNSLMGLLSELEKAFSLYVEMNKQTKTFTEFIDKKVKELREKQNVTKANGSIDNEDIQTDSRDERSGTEGIREGI